MAKLPGTTAKPLSCCASERLEDLWRKLEASAATVCATTSNLLALAHLLGVARHLPRSFPSKFSDCGTSESNLECIGLSTVSPSEQLAASLGRPRSSPAA